MDQQGNILLFLLRFTDLRATKMRPGVVMSYVKAKGRLDPVLVRTRPGGLSDADLAAVAQRVRVAPELPSISGALFDSRQTWSTISC
jgi:hypothetical protein